MKLSDFERWSLANQYEILAKLDPENDYYKRNREILQNGYEYLYSQIHELTSPVAESVSEEVCDILDMFRFIKSSVDQLSPDESSKLNLRKFMGFDGNNEGDHYAFAEFLCNKMGRYREFDGDMNSHTRMLSHYRLMLMGFKEIPSDERTTMTVSQLNFARLG